MLDYDAFKGIDRKYSKSIDMTSLNRDISWKIDSAKKHKELALSYSHKKSRERCPICNEDKYWIYVNVLDKNLSFSGGFPLLFPSYFYYIVF